MYLLLLSIVILAIIIIIITVTTIIIIIINVSVGISAHGIVLVRLEIKHIGAGHQLHDNICIAVDQ
jgi:hypothetical protein